MLCDQAPTKRLLVFGLVLAWSLGCRSVPDSLLQSRALGVPQGMDIQFQRSSWTRQLRVGLGTISDLPVGMVAAAIGAPGAGCQPGTCRILNVVIRRIEMDLALGWGVVSVFLSPLYIIGFPVLSARFTVDIEGALFHDGRVLETFRSQGRRREFSALYWGYNPEDAHRAAFLGALADAMAALRAQAERGRL